MVGCRAWLGRVAAVAAAVIATTVAAATMTVAAAPAYAGGLIVFHDARGIAVVNPATGHIRRLLAVPKGCTTSTVTVLPAIELSTPVWARSKGGRPEVYFWLTDWLLTHQKGCPLSRPPHAVSEAPLLIRANPRTGALHLAAVPPLGLPCEPGRDLAAIGYMLAFTNDDCDEYGVELAALPLRRNTKLQVASSAIAPGSVCEECVVVQTLLGPGEKGRLLDEEIGTQGPSKPPSLQWFDPATKTAGLFSPLPPLPSAKIVAAAAPAGGNVTAFAAGRDGAGVLNMTMGAWAPEPLPVCHHRCTGATDVSFSPNGGQLVIAANGLLVVDRASGAGKAKVLIGHDQVTGASWLGSTGASMGRGGGHTKSLRALLVSFAKTLGGRRLHVWRFFG